MKSATRSCIRFEARNTVEDSLLENLTITELLPEGLTFVLKAAWKSAHGGTGQL